MSDEFAKYAIAVVKYGLPILGYLGFSTWLAGLLNRVLPSPAAVCCGITELGKDGWYKLRGHLSRDAFAVLIAKLDEDPTGIHTRAVTRVFNGQRWIERRSTCRVLKIKGAGFRDEKAVVAQGRRWLARRDADLLIWGEVLESGRAVHLWFISNESASTFQESSFVLEHNLLTKNFEDIGKAKILTVALEVIKPATESKSLHLLEILKPLVIRLRTLFKNPPTMTVKAEIELMHALGCALRLVGAHEGDFEASEEAIHLFREALAKVDRIGDPYTWAKLHYQMGLAQLRLGDDESRTLRLNDAITSFRLALSEYNQTDSPIEWSKARNSLGNALVTIAEYSSDTIVLEEAIGELSVANSIYDPDVEIFNWVAGQNSLGAAWNLHSNIGSDRRGVDEAVRIFRAAIARCDRDLFPRLWCIVQINLANSLEDLSRFEDGRDALDEAIDICYGVLRECSKDISPYIWSTAKISLGAALCSIGKRTGDITHVREAVETYQLALEEYPRARAPRKWSITKHNLANALMIIAERTLGPIPASFRSLNGDPSALLAIPLQFGQRPDWTNPQRELAGAVQAAKEKRKALLILEDAAKAEREALEEITQENQPHLWALFHNNLAAILLCRGVYDDRDEEDDRIDQLVEAEAAARAALEVWDRSRQPFFWAQATHNLGIILYRAGTLRRSDQQLRNAIDVSTTALAVYEAEGTPIELANSQMNLAAILLELGDLTHDAACYKKAIEMCDASRSVVVKIGHLALLQSIEFGIGRAKVGLDALDVTIDVERL